MSDQEASKAAEIMRQVLDMRADGAPVYITPDGAAFMELLAEN
jgi:hypothetical protein